MLAPLQYVKIPGESKDDFKKHPSFDKEKWGESAEEQRGRCPTYRTVIRKCLQFTFKKLTVLLQTDKRKIRKTG